MISDWICGDEKVGAILGRVVGAALAWRAHQTMCIELRDEESEKNEEAKNGRGLRFA